MELKIELALGIIDILKLLIPIISPSASIKELLLLIFFTIICFVL